MTTMTTKEERAAMTALPERPKQKHPEQHKTIQERFRDFTGTYENDIVDWGRPVGKEIW